MKPKKESAMLVDIQYVRRKGNTTPDYLYIIWKDLDTGEKYLQTIPEPKMEIFFTKPEKRNYNYVKSYEYLQNLYSKTVKYREIPQAIAKEIGQGGVDELNRIYNTRDFKSMQNFYLWQYSFGADFDVRSWYRMQWLKTLDNDRPKKITKSFMDIEVNSFDVSGFPQSGQCPIDLVTVICAENKTSYTFALVNQYADYMERIYRDTSTMSKEEKIEYQREYTLKNYEIYKHRYEQEKYLMEHTDELKEELHAMFDDSYGRLDYKFYFYDNDELKMLIHLFQLINELKSDIMLIWNLPFDMPYISDRFKYFGVDPEDYICHKDFVSKECWFKDDKRNHELKNKGYFFYISSYTVYYCQMKLYAETRKGQQELRSNALNYIAQLVLKDNKLDYTDAGNIKTIGFTNYKKYFIYNIKDVLLQYGIEMKSKDVDAFYTDSYSDATPYDSVFKQTVSLRNLQYISYLEQGLIPGNNANRILLNKQSKPDEDFYEEDEENDDPEDDSFEGALVADPALNDYVGADLFGKPTNNIFYYAFDDDMKAFYPNSIIGCNIDPTTIIFKIILDPKQFNFFGGKCIYNGITAAITFFRSIREKKKNGKKKGSKRIVEEIDVSKECIDNFQTRNPMCTGHKWLNLPDTLSVYEHLKERL